MSLLTIIQNVSDELNLPQPSSIINNPNKTVRQMLSMANASGKRMFKRYAFTRLIKEFTYTTLAAEDQGAIQGTIITDSDWERFLPITLFNRSQTRRLKGPYTPQEWQRDKGTVSSTIQEYYRIRGGNLLIIPAPAAGETIAGEYLSKNWILDNDGTTTKAAFSEDADTSLIDEDLIELDVKWRWLSAHKFDYGEEKLEFEQEFANRTGQDRGGRIIDLAHPLIDDTRINTPESGFGQ